MKAHAFNVDINQLRHRYEYVKKTIATTTLSNGNELSNEWVDRYEMLVLFSIYDHEFLHLFRGHISLQLS